MQQRDPKVTPDGNRVFSFTGPQPVQFVFADQVTLAVAYCGDAGFAFRPARHAVVADQHVKRKAPPAGVVTAVHRCDAAVQKLEIQRHIFDLFHEFLPVSVEKK